MHSVIRTSAVWAAIFFASAANAFEANAIWVKGQPGLDVLKKLDPALRIDGFTIRDNEEVTLYVSYRAPARDKKKSAKVSYRISVEGPNGKPTNSLEDQKDILAGEGIVSDSHANDWAVSHGRVTLSFTEKDRRGTYAVKTTIKDHVSGEEIVRVTQIRLE